jgi:hypothetical protein
MSPNAAKAQYWVRDKRPAIAQMLGDGGGAAGLSDVSVMRAEALALGLPLGGAVADIARSSNDGTNHTSREAANIT